MNLSNCSAELLGNVLVGVFMLAVSVLFAFFGVTILPVFGFVLAVPVFALALKFLSAPFGTDACTIS